MNIIKRIHDWSKRKLHDKLLCEYGGTQTCPWCRQCAQSQKGWHFKDWDRDPMLNELKCGICGGTSLWRFELGMIYISPLISPTPNYNAVELYDVENAQLKTSNLIYDVVSEKEES